LAGRLYSSTGGTDTEPIEDCTAARTDAQGRFRIGGLPPGKNRVIASADQLAPTISPFNLTPDSQPLRIVLDPGATLSGTVVDAAGHPQSGVAVGCNQWNVEDSTPLARSTKTDVAGRFKLEHLPQQGELSILVDRKGFLGTSFSWSADKPTSPTIPLYKPPVVTGFVRDADTDAPIPRFDVMPGIYWNSHSEFDPLDFDGTDHVKSAGGRFSKRIQNIDVSLDLPRVAVRIVADGYLPQISPAVTPGKPYEPFVIHLKKAAPITGKVCLGDGQPVDGAAVFLVEPQNTAFVQGLSVDEDTVASPQIHGTTDPAGNFKLSAADPSSRVLVLHSFGYAIVSAASLTASSSIALTPWARVSGVLHIAGKPINGKVLWLAPSPIPPRRSPAAIVFQLQATTRIDGSFEFDDVPAMNWTLSPAADRDGTTLSPRPVQTKPGQTLQVDLVDGNTAATSQP
jgi:Carboxypeptidase regulatory-like domain